MECAICHESHTTDVRTMADGSAHIFTDAATYRRRSIATLQAKIRVNEVVGAPTANLRAQLKAMQDA